MPPKHDTHHATPSRIPYPDILRPNSGPRRARNRVTEIPPPPPVPMDSIQVDPSYHKFDINIILDELEHIPMFYLIYDKYPYLLGDQNYPLPVDTITAEFEECIRVVQSARQTAILPCCAGQR